MFVLHEKKIAGVILLVLARRLLPISPPIPQEVREDTLTWQRAAEDLQPHADAPAVEPGLRVDADVAGHRGDGQLVENRDLLFTVSFKYLLMHKGGGKETPLELDYQGMKESETHSCHKTSLGNTARVLGIKGKRQPSRAWTCPQEVPISWVERVILRCHS